MHVWLPVATGWFISIRQATICWSYHTKLVPQNFWTERSMRCETKRTDDKNKNANAHVLFSWYKRKSKWHRNQRFFSALAVISSSSSMSSQHIFVCVIFRFSFFFLLLLRVHFICTSMLDGWLPVFRCSNFFVVVFCFFFSVSFLLSFVLYTIFRVHTMEWKNVVFCSRSMFFAHFFCSPERE